MSQDQVYDEPHSEASAEPSQPRADSGWGEWERQFVDDLVAANRLKTYLVSQGVELPEKALEGLAALSERHKWEIEQLIRDERERWAPRAPWRWLLRREAA